MYAVNKEEFIKSLFEGANGQVRELGRLDISADWDPDVIRESTTRQNGLAETILRNIKAYLIPGIFVLAFIAQLSGLGILSHLCMGLFAGLLVLSGLGAVMDWLFMNRNEKAGNYRHLADFLYRSGSTYWKYRDFNEDLSVSFKPVAYVAFLAAATVTLGWYLGLFLLTLTALTNGYVVLMRDKKAQSLILYKKKWDIQVEAEQELAIRQAEEEAEKEREINKIILESRGETPEPNAMDENGSVYVPDDLPDGTDLATYN